MRSSDQSVLKDAVRFVFQEFFDSLGENRGFDKSHLRHCTSMADTCNPPSIGKSNPNTEAEHQLGRRERRNALPACTKNGLLVPAHSRRTSGAHPGDIEPGYL